MPARAPQGRKPGNGNDETRVTVRGNRKVGDRKAPPWIEFQIVHDLAGGILSQTEIARKFGLSQPYISHLKQKNSLRIDSIVADKENAYAGLWVADKSARIGVLQETIERINTESQTYVDRGEPIPPALSRALMQALRNVSEELGQLTQKVDTSNVVTYRIEGVNPAGLT